MATRSGSVDPGLLLWLLEHEAVSERELAEALEHESGLLRPRRQRRHARGPRARGRGRRRRRARARRLPAPAARAIARDGRRARRPRRARVHRRRRRARPPQSARGRRPGLRSWASRSTRPRTRASPTMPTSAPPAHPCARSSCTPARTSRSRTRCASCWVASQAGGARPRPNELREQSRIGRRDPVDPERAQALECPPLVDRPGVQPSAAGDHIAQQLGVDQPVLGHQRVPAPRGDP